MKNVRIDNVSTLCSLVREAAQAKVSLSPHGGGTQEHRLLPSQENSWQVDLRSLNQVIDYPFADLTVTVQAGITLAQLQQILAEQRQTLPIDVPYPELATVGGSIAANVNGPRRFGWGAWRDYLIGVSFVNDRGEEAKAGGRVVKNVAGYDLCKLMTGSFGTLGIITQVSLKVRPLPEKRVIVPVQVEPSSISKLIETLRYSRLRPVMLILTQEAEKLIIHAGFEDSAAAVDWQVEHLRETCHMHGVQVGRVLEEKEALATLQQLTSFPVLGEGIIYQIALLPSQISDLLPFVVENSQAAQVDAAVGLILGNLEEKLGVERRVETISHLRQQAQSLNGYLTLLRYPPDLADQLLPFGPERTDWALMRQVKQALDPGNIFQAGRFPPINVGQAF